MIAFDIAHEYLDFVSMAIAFCTNFLFVSIPLHFWMYVIALNTHTHTPIEKKKVVSVDLCFNVRALNLFNVFIVVDTTFKKSIEREVHRSATHLLLFYDDNDEKKKKYKLQKLLMNLLIPFKTTQREHTLSFRCRNRSIAELNEWDERAATHKTQRKKKNVIIKPYNSWPMYYNWEWKKKNWLKQNYSVPKRTKRN